ncbi:HAD hydrolase family protein, partial [Staphylococcus hominis]
SGHQVIFASARPIRDMLPVISKEFHNYTMIGGNGSLILSNGKIIKSVSFSLSDSFSLSEMKKIKQLINEFDATYLIDGDWDYAYTGP